MHRLPLVVELGTEEIPVAEQRTARTYLHQHLLTLFQDHGWSELDLKVWSTPHRLVVYCPAFPDREPDREEKIKGPPAHVAYDSDGRPTSALHGFVNRHHAYLDQVSVEETPKGSYVFLRLRRTGRPALEVMPELLTRAFASIPFVKRMRWPGSETPFTRPIRWILALLGRNVIPWRFSGVQAGTTTRGLRQGTRGEILEIKDAHLYLQQLQTHWVMVDNDQRRAIFQEAIQNELRRLAQEHNVTLAAPEDPELLDFWVHISEWPRVFSGSFDPVFLAIPEPILVTAMRHHQKYLPVLDAEGRLQPYFLAPLLTLVANIEPIRATHERVLVARFRDAQFFWDEDRNTGLEAYARQLHTIQFLESGGTLADKVARQRDFLSDMVALWELPDATILEQGLRLYKADLVTHLVGEFPELEGTVGALLAEAAGMPSELVRALRDVNRPQRLDDPIPETPAGQALVFLDRSDALLVSFGLGHAPTGSSDPLGQRRWALAVLRILIESHRHVDLFDFWHRYYRHLGQRLPALSPWDAVAPLLRETVHNRLTYYWQSLNFHTDHIRSLLGVTPFDPYDLHLRITALNDAPAGDVYRLGLVYKRLMSMTRDITAPQPPDPDLFYEDLEKELFQKVQDLEKEIEAALQRRDYVRVIRSLASLSPVLHRFFEEVYVMTDDPATRNNRLHLLASARSLYERFADLGQWTVEVHEVF